MAQAARDQNFIPTALAVTDDGNATPTRLIVDPTTKRLKVSAVITSGGGLTSLNALTGATQTFATATTGTDFTIASSGTVHTFAIPTASATNRGLLSTTDWSRFDTAVGASGTVTSVSVTTANGVSGSVATATTTPAITLTLGAITPTSVNGNTITTGTGTLTLGAGSTLVTSATNSITLTSTGATNVTLPTSGTLYGTATGSITSAQLLASLTNETGTGLAVFNDTPTLIAPALGAATATSINGLTITSSTGTFTLTNAKTLAVTNTLTLSGTDSTTMTFPSSTATIARTDAGQTFTGVQVFTSPTITTASLNGANTLAENASIALDPAGSADGKYTGITVTGTAGATLAFGDLIYLDPTDSRWELTDANSAAAADGDSRGILGMCVLAAAADGSATTILLQGIIRADTAFPALTINAPVYVSETAGDIVVTQPVTADVVIRVCGFALTADEIYFNPSPDYITHV